MEIFLGGICSPLGYCFGTYLLLGGFMFLILDSKEIVD